MSARTTRVFRFIWRVNAIVIFLLAIVLVALGSLLLWQMLSAPPRDRGRGPLPGARDSSRARPPVARPATSFGELRAVPGTPFAIIPVEEDHGPFRRRDRDVRDLLVYDGRAHTLRSLFAPGARLVVRHDVIAAVGSPPAVPPLLLVQVIERDANDDGELDAADPVSLLVCDPAATCTRLLEAADGIDDDVRLRPSPELLVLRVARADGSEALVELDLARRAVARELPLPTPP